MARSLLLDRVVYRFSSLCHFYRKIAVKKVGQVKTNSLLWQQQCSGNTAKLFSDNYSTTTSFKKMEMTFYNSRTDTNLTYPIYFFCTGNAGTKMFYRDQAP